MKQASSRDARTGTGRSELRPESAQAMFRDRATYDALLHHGLAVSGEDKRYFLAGRVDDLAAQLGAARRPRRILDFGCGLGDTTQYLAETFPDAHVTGVDSVGAAIEDARRRFGCERVSFQAAEHLAPDETFDLCYVNGVFHHIPPVTRVAVVRRIRDCLVAGGLLALMENNPWNVGARIVMKRIEFDRDAIPLSPRETRRLLLEAGFELRDAPRFLFYFPRPLAFLRFLEPWLARVPLGAQYYYLATKPEAP
jgi:SAM-dependent methyltransferase